MAEGSFEIFEDFKKDLENMGYVERENINQQLIIPVGVNNLIRPRERDFLMVKKTFKHRYYILESHFRPDLYPLNVTIGKPCFQCNLFTHEARQCPDRGNERLQDYNGRFTSIDDVEFQHYEELRCAYENIDYVSRQWELCKFEIDRLLHVISRIQIEDQQELNFAGQISAFYQDQFWILKRKLDRQEIVKLVPCRVADSDYLLKQKQNDLDDKQKTINKLLTEKIVLVKENNRLRNFERRAVNSFNDDDYNSLMSEVNDLKNELLLKDEKFDKMSKENDELKEINSQLRSDKEHEQICVLGKQNNALRRANETLSKQVQDLNGALLVITRENDDRKNRMSNWTQLEEKLSLMEYSEVINFFTELKRLKEIETQFNQMLANGMFKAVEAQPCNMDSDIINNINDNLSVSLNNVIPILDDNLSVQTLDAENGDDNRTNVDTDSTVNVLEENITTEDDLIVSSITVNDLIIFDTASNDNFGNNSNDEELNVLDNDSDCDTVVDDDWFDCDTDTETDTELNA